MNNNYSFLYKIYSVFTCNGVHKAVGTVLRYWAKKILRGASPQIFLYHTYISKGYNFVHVTSISVISNIHVPILAVLLCTDLYVVIFKLFNFLVGKILRGQSPCPLPVPTAMHQKGDML